MSRAAVVRVADEIVVDLMARACGIEYAEAARDADRLYLEELLRAGDERRVRGREEGNERPP